MTDRLTAFPRRRPYLTEEDGVALWNKYFACAPQDGAAAAEPPRGLRVDDKAWATPEMIEAGVSCLREMRFGESLERVVEAIYIAMEVERRAIDAGGAAG